MTDGASLLDLARGRARYSLHDSETGQIRAVVVSSESIAERNLRVGEALLEIEIAVPVSGETHYVVGLEHIERPLLGLSDPTSGAIPTGGGLDLEIPDGAEVRVDGEIVGEAEGGGLALEFPYAGQFEVVVKAFPYRDERLTVTVE